MGNSGSLVVQLLNHAWLFVTPWIVAHQASLSFTISQSLLERMSTESVMLSNHLILCCSLLLLPSIFPSIRVYPMNQLFASGGQSAGASASLLPTNIQDWFPLRLTGLISLLSKGLSWVFSSSTLWKHQFFVFFVAVYYYIKFFHVYIFIYFSWAGLLFGSLFLSSLST